MKRSLGSPQLLAGQGRAGRQYKVEETTAPEAPTTPTGPGTKLWKITPPKQTEPGQPG